MIFKPVAELSKVAWWASTGLFLGSLSPLNTRLRSEPVLCPQGCLVGPHWTHVSSWVRSCGQGLGIPPSGRCALPTVHGLQVHPSLVSSMVTLSACWDPSFSRGFCCANTHFQEGNREAWGVFPMNFGSPGESRTFCPTPDLCGRRSEAPCDLSWDRLL